MCVCMCVCVCSCMYVCVCKCVYMYVCICMCVCMYVYVCVCMCVCVSVNALVHPKLDCHVMKCPFVAVQNQQLCVLQSYTYKSLVLPRILLGDPHLPPPPTLLFLEKKENKVEFSTPAPAGASNPTVYI